MEIVKGISMKALIVGLIIIVVFNWFTGIGEYLTILEFMGTGTMGITRYGVNEITYSFGIMFFMTLILGLVNSYKHVFNRKEMAMIFIMSLFAISQPASIFGGFGGYGGSLQSGMAAAMTFTPEKYEIWKRYAPGQFYGPLDQDLIKYTAKNSVPPNFGPWMPAIGWGFMFYLTFSAVLLFTILIFTRPCITSEALAVPGVQVFQEAIELTQTKEDKKGIPFLKNKVLWIGFAISFLPTFNRWMLPFSYSFSAADPLYGTIWTSPWATQYRTWFNQIFGFLGASTGLQPAAYIMMDLTWYPYMTAWSFLMPFDLVLSWLVFNIIFFIILPPIFASTGFFPAPPYPWWFWKVPWMAPYAGAEVPIHQLYISIPTGIFISVIVYTMWRARARMKPIFLALFKAPPKEIDDESPLPYRYCWIGLIVAALAFWGVLVIAAGPGSAGLWIISIILLVVTWIGFGRIAAEANWMGASDTPYSFEAERMWQGWVAGAVNGTPGTGWTGDMIRPRMMLGQIYHYPHMGGPAYQMGGAYTVYAMKIGDLYEMDKKSIVITLFICIIVATLVAAFSWVYWFSVLNAAGGTQWGTSWGPYSYHLAGGELGPFDFNYGSEWPLTPGVYGMIAAFFVVGIGLYTLRERVGFLRWLNPLGIWWAFGMAFIWPMPVPYGFLIISVVVKWLSFRVKGVEWYSKVIVPLAAGMLLGWGAAQLIYRMGLMAHNLGFYGAGIRGW